MFAAGMYDPDAMFFAEGEMGYPADEIFYPEEMGYLPEGMEYVPEGMGFPPEGMGFLPDGMGYAMDNMGYTEDMVYADEMGYNNEMGYPEEIYGTTPTGPMATGENFDHEVPHTYYEDDDENSEGEGQVVPDLICADGTYSWNCKSLLYEYLLSHDYKFLLFLFSHCETKTQIVSLNLQNEVDFIWFFITYFSEKWFELLKERRSPDDLTLKKLIWYNSS